MTQKKANIDKKNSSVDLKRRSLLTAATVGVGAVGAGFTAVPFLSSWNPSAAAVAAGAPVDVNIASLQKGQLIIVEWRSKPVWIVNRPDASLAQLESLNTQLRDPNSDLQQQPSYAKNPNRSIRKDIFVAVGLCTHLGCSPQYRPEVAPADLGSQWKGGFFCPCHGSRFDLAGRVYKGVPAPLNLEIPPYTFIDDHTIRIGEDHQGQV